MKVLWLFDRDFVWSLPFITAWLWQAGGSGFNFLRRLGVSLIITLYGLSLGLPIFLALIYLILAILTFSLDYGQKTSDRLSGAYIPYLFTLGLAYGGTTLPIYIHFPGRIYLILGSIICSIVFGGLTVASQRLKFPAWKWVEGLTGFSIGLTAAMAMR